MSEYDKPLPPVDDDSLPFWEAAKRHELVIQKCKNSGAFYCMASYCIKCQAGFNTPWAENMEWVKACGKGKVWTYIVAHYPFVPSFADDVPYNLTVIELDEGPLMQSCIVGCDNNYIKVGMPVEVVFEDVTPDISLPKWKPIG